MNAREMFEKLGYTKYVYDNRIVYEYGNYVMRDIIDFNLKCRIVHSYTGYEVGNVIKGLTVNELKAVNQQMEELGWVEGTGQDRGIRWMQKSI